MQKQMLTLALITTLFSFAAKARDCDEEPDVPNHYVPVARLPADEVTLMRIGFVTDPYKGPNLRNDMLNERIRELQRQEDRLRRAEAVAKAPRRK